MIKMDYTQIKKNAMYAYEPLFKNTYNPKHLEDCNWNPTIGLIARHKYSGKQNPLTGKPRTIKYLEEALKNRIASMYPKTQKIREYIIQDNRLSLNHVTKSKGYNLLDKLKIFLK